MLGTPPPQGRRQPFVCALCRRQRLSSLVRLPRSRASIVSSASALQFGSPASIHQPPSNRWAARFFSISTPLRDVPQSKGPSAASRFPGAFAGRQHVPLGSFASGPARSNAAPQAGDGLLPHEREARERTAAASARSPPAVPPNSARDPTLRPSLTMSSPSPSFASPPAQSPEANPAGSSLGGGGLRGGSARDQISRSRSVLQNVFSANREPRPPPTPASWQTPGRDEGSRSAATTRDSRPRSAFPNALNSHGQPRSPSTAASWDTHSHHARATTPTRTQGSGVRSSLADVLNSHRRSQLSPAFGFPETASHREGSAPAGESSASSPRSVLGGLFRLNPEPESQTTSAFRNPVTHHDRSASSAEAPASSTRSILPNVLQSNRESSRAPASMSSEPAVHLEGPASSALAQGSGSVAAKISSPIVETRSLSAQLSWSKQNPKMSYTSSPEATAASAQLSIAQQRPRLGMYANRKVQVSHETLGPSENPEFPQRQPWGSFGDRKPQLADQVAESSAQGPLNSVGPSASLGTPRRQGWGSFGDRKAQITEPVAKSVGQAAMAEPKGSNAPMSQGPSRPAGLSGNVEAPQRQVWGSFGNRKAQISEILVKPAAQSTATEPKDIASLLKSARVSDQSYSTPKAKIQDFWGELENRFAGLHEKSSIEQGTAPTEGRPESQASPQQESGTAPEDAEEPALTEKQLRRRWLRSGSAEDERPISRNTKKSKKSGRRSKADENDDELDDDDAERWEQQRRAKADKKAQLKQISQEVPTATPIFLPEYISVWYLSQALKQHSNQFIKDMEEMGFEHITLDTIMTGETAALVAMEYGFEPTVDTGSQRDLRPRPAPENVSELPARPPVVTIMGHVDHGKTTLLDWLRKSSVAAQEHGGITQHIGAFVVKMSSGKPITFLDTPGHAAFLAMRQRGANVTDIVVLVVAADDGIMPQTIEALKHATAAKVPIVVAINKVDKEDARVDFVKADLSRHGVEIEDYGGDVQVVCVSGKTGQGMDALEESIVTLSEVLDVRAETDGAAEGWILESSVKVNGKAATVLIKRGTLRLGDFIVAGKSWARVRLLRNEAGIEIDEAPPGTPVEVLGWREVPPAGEQVLQAHDEAAAKSAVEYRTEMAEREESSQQLAEQEQRERERAAAAEAAGLTTTATTKNSARARGGAAPSPAAGAETSDEQDMAGSSSTASGPALQNFSVKADVAGSVEAVCSSILELGNHEVRPVVLRSSTGQLSEFDVDHAATSGSILVNFNSPVPPHIRQRAQAAKVRIMDHSVIYSIVDDAKAALSALLPETVTSRVLGEADVAAVFAINVKKRVFQNIAGCRVRNGAIKKSSRVRILRGRRVIFDGLIESLKQGKNDVTDVSKGSECGISLEGFQDFAVDDQIQTYEEIRTKRHL